MMMIWVADPPTQSGCQVAGIELDKAINTLRTTPGAWAEVKEGYAHKHSRSAAMSKFKRRYPDIEFVGRKTEDGRQVIFARMPLPR